MFPLPFLESSWDSALGIGAGTDFDFDSVARVDGGLQRFGHLG
jgi:hypothetical protein